jgi:hypothetical protein
MRAPDALGHQHVDTLAQEFLLGVAKEPFGVGVGEEDSPVLVDHNHRIRGRFDGEGKALLGAPDLRDIPRDRGGTDTPSGGITDGGNRE